MMKLINMTLVDVINTYPDVKTVLQVFHLDSGEYQQASLWKLLNIKSLPRAEFINSVQQALMVSTCTHYKGMSAARLTHEIIQRFHDPHRAQILGLINDARYIEKKFPEHNSCPQGLSSLLNEFTSDLVSHMEQEELYLFPTLAAAGDSYLFAQLAIAHHSHDRHINMMARLRSLTHDFTPPDDAPPQWQGLYESLLEFVLQLNMHIAIEHQFLLND